MTEEYRIRLIAAVPGIASSGAEAVAARRLQAALMREPFVRLVKAFRSSGGSSPPLDRLSADRILRSIRDLPGH